MKGAILFTILLLPTLFVNAQKTNYSAVDKRILTLEPDKSISLPFLVRILTMGCETPELKARAIYAWISQNMKYDSDRPGAGDTTNYEQDPAKILQSRKGISIEFATLGNAMFNEAGIPSKIIDGIAQNKATYGTKMYSWNAVQLAGKWNLIDLLGASDDWAQGVISNAYFLVPADQFIMSHFPTEKEWSLLTTTPLLTEFIDYPIFDAEYFRYATFPYPTQKVLVATNGELTLRRFLNENFDEVIKVYKEGRIYNYKKLGNGKIGGLEKGEYELVVGVNRTSPGENSMTEVRDMISFKLTSK
jgi:hypothetical protein